MSQNNMITFLANDPDGMIKALHLAHNALLPQYTITCSNSHKTLGNMPLEALQSAVSFFNNSASDFSKSQLRQTSSEYCYNPFTDRTSVTNRKKYMCTVKETNDVRCVGAEIGEILRSRLNGKNTLANAIREYQKWINEFFKYKSTGRISDHTAIGLLTNRTGVCQSIAAVTMIVFPHLGYPVKYISGTAYSGKAWGPHAWNAIKAKDRWIHVDFTFGMNSSNTPNNDSYLGKYMFMKTHRWDNHLLSNSILSTSNNIITQIYRDRVELFVNKNTFLVGNVVVHSDAPVLVGNSNVGYWIDLSRILSFFECSCEYLPTKNQLRVCLKNHSVIINNASNLIDQKTGYINVSVLKNIVNIDDENKGSIIFRMR